MSEEFVGSPRPTLGVEWEIAFVDRTTRDLVPCASEALEIIESTHPDHRIQREFLANTLELVTGVCDTVPDAMADLGEQLSLVRGAAEKLGVDVWSSGSHPFARGTDLEVSEKSTYNEIIARTQWWGRQMLIWGVHVHVGVRDDSRVWPIINALLTNLPHFLALSASSPAWNGQDMGYASNRTMLYRQLPTAGLPPDVGDWESWRAYMHDQSVSGVINHTGSMHIDIRPASKYGTIEVRVADATSNMRELAAIVALTHCLVVHYDEMLDRGADLPSLQYWHNDENKWRACRYGMDALIIVDRDTNERWVKDDLGDLLTTLEPIAERLGCADELRGVRDIVRGGAGYERQRRAAETAGALPSLTSEPDVLAVEADLGHSPWVAAVDLAVREMAAGRPLEG
ncbi:glutamate--cysteine ligase [uncultured Corynebacterium sp.]|uniref:glutamate--cysteine ligase n=1 Tax=uncultured Corynebacterium sp. TaxID=159447 RepID=UPI0025F5E044|nr:glutamate--cysteine ligase [uncultured Corynebacterium sp.]